MHKIVGNRLARAWPFLISLACLLAAALPAMALLPPTETSMGSAQRIVYIHVPVAWLGLLGLVTMAVSSGMYLARRSLWWDHWSQAASEVGWLCGGLTLVSGSLWAHAAWGTWWTWDPRLTSAFVLWMIYSGYLLLRAQFDDPHYAGAPECGLGDRWSPRRSDSDCGRALVPRHPPRRCRNGAGDARGPRVQRGRIYNLVRGAVRSAAAGNSNFKHSLKCSHRIAIPIGSITKLSPDFQGAPDDRLCCDLLVRMAGGDGICRPISPAQATSVACS